MFYLIILAAALSLNVQAAKKESNSEVKDQSIINMLENYKKDIENGMEGDEKEALMEFLKKKKKKFDYQTIVNMDPKILAKEGLLTGTKVKKLSDYCNKTCTVLKGDRNCKKPKIRDNCKKICPKKTTTMCALAK